MMEVQMKVLEERKICQPSKVDAGDFEVKERKKKEKGEQDSKMKKTHKPEEA